MLLAQTAIYGGKFNDALDLLATGIEERTGATGGSVIWGGIRDLDQVREKPTPTFYRGYDPTAIMQVVMTGRDRDTVHTGFVVVADLRGGGAACVGDVLVVHLRVRVARPQYRMAVVAVGAGGRRCIAKFRQLSMHADRVPVGRIAVAVAAEAVDAVDVALVAT